MQPTVSIIVPCYNEEATIGSLLSAIAGQTYPAGKLEVIIADGLSTDGTRAEISKFRQNQPALALRVVENPKRTIPAGLNAAIQVSTGEIIVRLDAHSIPIPEYVERCVRNLEAAKGANVGGVWSIEPGAPTWMARGIAAAAAHPLGAGDALYRVGGGAKAVDTVPFGAFWRSLINEVGGFDESLLTNEDYEFNVRVGRRGGVIWMDPEIRSTYFARATLAALASQYWRYGFWKLKMLQRHPQSIRWRQGMPALFVVGLAALGITALFWAPAAAVLAGILLVYCAALLGAGIQMGLRAREAAIVPAGVAALATMHLAWGAGFWWSLLNGWFARHG